MLPKYLKIHGYRSYVDAEIDFYKFGNLFCVIGENGAGKSSIIEMITTALYYRNSCTDNNGAGMDEVINSDCDYFELQFCFEMNNSEYLIQTKKQRNKTRELKFFIDGVDQSEKVSETQKKINDIIKLDYDVFLDTVCIGQGMSARFMHKKPNERKETLAQILDIKKYEAYEKEAKETKKTLKTKIDDLTRNINFINSQQEDIDSLNAVINNNKQENEKMKETLKELNLELEAITKEKIEYESLINKNALILKQRKQLQSQLASLKKSIVSIKEKLENIQIEDVDYNSKIDILQKEIDEKREAITSMKETISKLNTENSFFEKEKKAVKEKYRNLQEYDKSICDFCGNEITSSHKEKHLNELKQSYEEIDKKINSNNKKLNECKELGLKLSEKGKTLSQEKKKLQEQKEANEKAKVLKDKLENEASLLKKSYDEYKNQYKENTSIEIIDVQEKTFNDNEIRYKVNKINNSISENERSIGVAQSKLENALKNEKILKKLNDELSEVKLVLSDYDSASVAFGKKGIQKSIIKKDLPGIEIEINNILRLLSDNAMSIKFITDKKGNKKDIDTLDVIVQDGINVRNYETYSGGERFRIDFSCHIGLAKFLTKRAGASIDFFIVDEGLGSQDSSARQKFIDTLYKTSKIFKQVMCITHINELQDSFNTKVLIEKDAIKGSQVSVLE